jgi:hypothetical protein
MASFEARQVVTAAMLAIGGVGCAPLVGESDRPCPCSEGYQCCLGTCVSAEAACGDASGAAAPDAASSAIDGEAGVGSDVSPGVDVVETAADGMPGTVDSSEAPLDAGAADGDAGSLDARDGAPDGAPGCPALPAPVVHFAFADCADAGTVRDTTGGALGVLEGYGVHCDTSPVGGALRFDGALDGGGGSYVRVVDSPDASSAVCGDGGVCPQTGRSRAPSRSR